MRIRTCLAFITLLALLAPAITAAEPAAGKPADSTAALDFEQVLDRWLQGDGLASTSLMGLRPGMAVAEADGMLSDTGYSYSNHIQAYRTARPGDRSRVRLQYMGSELGFVEVQDELPGPVDLDQARSLLVARLGAPAEESGAAGHHLVLAWQRDDIRLTAVVGGSAQGGEDPGLVRLQLWTTRLDDYERRIVQRCLDLRALPPDERTPEQVQELLRCPMSVFE
ncbi:hypothetical protein [Thioalbus denitrificans]|uniref:Uncharacterized protein n=1 Tax=Thioalbus denitrificans TaxID=547122 RepID=A0A369CME3_9GAMM|nr:hypothetical protein [Thioalbus denitrificans]RCX33034.1 hypothetical protein DFQ59_101333 [Thioalbus denitrificans]